MYTAKDIVKEEMQVVNEQMKTGLFSNFLNKKINSTKQQATKDGQG